MTTFALVLMSSTLAANATNLRSNDPSLSASGSEKIPVNAAFQPRAATGFEITLINASPFYPITTLSVPALSTAQAAHFKSKPSFTPWKSLTHIMYKHEPPAVSCVAFGGWPRPYGNVALTGAGARSCRDQCKNGGYNYFGMECPMTTTVHCQCSNATGGTPKGTEYCDGKGNPLVHAHAQCVGPYTVDGYMFGDYGVGSVYSTEAEAGQWKIVELAKKDQVLGAGPFQWVAKTPCDAGNQHCGKGQWKEFTQRGGSWGTRNSQGQMRLTFA